jgi:hypothetical protein
MTTEKILQELVAMKIDTEDIYNNGYIVYKDKYNELVEELKQAIRDENNKKSGKSNTAKLGKAILKNAIANTGGNGKYANKNVAMRFAHTEDGVQYVLDGHRIAYFFDPVDLPEYDKDGDWYHIDRLLNVEVENEELELPTIGEVKAELKANKNKVMYTFNNGITVNARYLLDYMEAFADIRVYATVGKRVQDRYLWIESELGGGILLGINAHDVTPGFNIAK